MKLSKTQIELIIANTPSELKGLQISFERNLGCFMPANANWAFYAGYVAHNGGRVLVVHVFGEIQ